MRKKIEDVLYIDSQQVKPAGYCPKCKGALYLPSLHCLRCGEDRL